MFKKTEHYLAVLFLGYMLFISLSSISGVKEFVFRLADNNDPTIEITDSVLIEDGSILENSDFYSYLIKNDVTLKGKYLGVSETNGIYFVNAIADYDTTALIYLQFEITSSQFNTLLVSLPDHFKITGSVTSIHATTEECDISASDEELLVTVERVLISGRCYSVSYL